MSQAGQAWLFLAMAVAPGVLLAWYFYRRDRWEREPPALVIGTFIAGALSALALRVPFELFGRAGLSVGTQATTFAVLLAPLVEEPVKFLVVRLYPYRRPEFNEPMDGIVYGAAAALGFASLENVLYVLSALPESVEIAETLLLYRAVLAVPGHALFAVPWALALGMAKVTPDPVQRVRRVAWGLCLGMLFHGAHNLLATLHPVVDGAYLFVLAVALWLFAEGRIREALRRSPFAPGGSKSSDPP